MFLIKLLSHLPLGVLYVIADMLAFLVHYVVRYRIRVVRRNVDLCFPELSEKERKAIVRRYYHHLADIAAEAVWFGGCSAERFRKQRLVEVLNPETLHELSSDGKSVIILSSHIGNWELSGGVMFYNYTDKPFPPSEQNYVCIYKRLQNKKWDAFIARNRVAVVSDPEHFEGYVETHDVLRYVLLHRNEQKFYNIITDQHPYKAAKGSVEVTFLGQKCKSMAAAANLAQRFGFHVVYQRSRCPKRGNYTLEYVPITSDSTKVTAQDIMQRYYDLMTEDIKAQPEQNLWSHKRFR